MCSFANRDHNRPQIGHTSAITSGTSGTDWAHRVVPNVCRCDKFIKIGHIGPIGHIGRSVGPHDFESLPI